MTATQLPGRGREPRPTATQIMGRGYRGSDLGFYLTATHRDLLPPTTTRPAPLRGGGVGSRGSGRAIN